MQEPEFELQTFYFSTFKTCELQQPLGYLKKKKCSHSHYTLRLRLDNLKLMERNETEQNGIEIPFHCLDISRRNGTNFPLHCLESERNKTCYNFFIPFLPFSLKISMCNQYMFILPSINTIIFLKKKITP